MKKITLEKVSYILAGAAFISLHIKENINSIFFVSFILSILSIVIINRKSFSLSEIPKTPTLLMLGYYIIGVVGFYANPESDNNYFIRLIPFFVSPLLFYYFNTSTFNLSRLLKLYVITNLLVLFVLDIWAIIDMIKNNSLYVMVENREYYRFLYTRYTRLEYFNPIYLSAYTFLSSVLILQYKFFNKRTRWIILGYTLFHLFIIGSRATVISILFGSIIFLLFASIKNRRYFKYLGIFSISLFLLISTAYIYRDTLFFNRYSQVFEWYKKKEIVLERNYSINNRIKIYILGSSACSESSGLIYGTGVAEKEIKKTYYNKFEDKFPFKTQTYNTHNQYINNFIDWGYIGVILLIWLLVCIIWNNSKQKLMWITFFWLCFSILLTMESVLFRHKGIILFILHYTILFQQPQSKKQH